MSLACITHTCRHRQLKGTGFTKFWGWVASQTWLSHWDLSHWDLSKGISLPTLVSPRSNFLSFLPRNSCNMTPASGSQPRPPWPIPTSLSTP